QQILDSVGFRPFIVCSCNNKIFIASISNKNNDDKIKQFQDKSASLVWKQTQLLQNYDGNNLFGINHPLVQSKTQELHEKMFSQTCILDDWNNEETMQHMFKLYLKNIYLEMKNFGNVILIVGIIKKYNY
ncbi:5034_t:CDS:2, partial [Funneliformis geosporum]